MICPKSQSWGLNLAGRNHSPKRGDRYRLATYTHLPPLGSHLREKGNGPTTAHEAPQDLPATSSHSPPHSSHWGSSLPLRNSRHPPTSRSLRWLPWGLELSSPTATTPTSFRPLLKCHLPSQGAPQPQCEKRGNCKDNGKEQPVQREESQESSCPGGQETLARQLGWGLRTSYWT